MIDLTPGLVLQCLGAIALAACAWTLYRTRRAARWPRAEATVIESCVARDADLDRHASRARNTDSRERPVLRYRYEVGGRSRESDRLYPHGSVGMSTSRARRLVADHPAGSTLRIRYDPAQPSDAALDMPLPKWVPIMQCVAGVALLLAGTVLARGG